MFENQETGENLSYDESKPGPQGHRGKSHWHRRNPKTTGDHDKYLDTELEDHNSVFWNKVWDHKALTGLLLGFGYINSWLYHWKEKYKSENNERSEYFNQLQLEYLEEKNMDYPTIDNFPLPIFAYKDPQKIEEYKLQRDDIKKKYQQGDFLEITLNQLCSKN
jgi:hypothetical protein